ncbi:hypothetical protein IWQ62_001390 [Dispira parvispora]|uniref:Pentatricopeptide repeat domain-containing protein n=1 Tax=Dispira parvispora TaxID=1520584 RepID=A0A9W8E3X1_9FUNG|nr:hypothetical protein IWQ62_001390 [Dispira parvispora]
MFRPLWLRRWVHSAVGDTHPRRHVVGFDALSKSFLKYRESKGSLKDSKEQPVSENTPLSTPEIITQRRNLAPRFARLLGLTTDLNQLWTLFYQLYRARQERRIAPGDWRKWYRLATTRAATMRPPTLKIPNLWPTIDSDDPSPFDNEQEADKDSPISRYTGWPQEITALVAIRWLWTCPQSREILQQAVPTACQGHTFTPLSQHVSVSVESRTLEISKQTAPTSIQQADYDLIATQLISHGLLDEAWLTIWVAHRLEFRLPVHTIQAFFVACHEKQNATSALRAWLNLQAWSFYPLDSRIATLLVESLALASEQATPGTIVNEYGIPIDPAWDYTINHQYDGDLVDVAASYYRALTDRGVQFPPSTPVAFITAYALQGSEQGVTNWYQRLQKSPRWSTQPWFQDHGVDIITGLGRVGQWQTCLQLVTENQRKGHRISKLLTEAVVGALRRAGQYQEIMNLQEFSAESLPQWTLNTAIDVLHAHAHTNRSREGIALWERLMVTRPRFTLAQYNNLFPILARLYGGPQRVWVLYRDMCLSGVGTTLSTYHTLFDIGLQYLDLPATRMVFPKLPRELRRAHIPYDVRLANQWLEYLVRTDQTAQAIKWIETMLGQPYAHPNHLSFSCIIRHLCDKEQVRDAVNFLPLMRNYMVEPTVELILMILRQACTQADHQAVLALLRYELPCDDTRCSGDWLDWIAEFVHGVRVAEGKHQGWKRHIDSVICTKFPHLELRWRQRLAKMP